MQDGERGIRFMYYRVRSNNLLHRKRTEMVFYRLKRGVIYYEKFTTVLVLMINDSNNQRDAVINVITETGNNKVYQDNHWFPI